MTHASSGMSVKLILRTGLLAVIFLGQHLVAASAQERSVTLVGQGGVRVKVTQDTPVLPTEIDAKSIRVFINGGPVSLCENPSYGRICMIIRNDRIACDLDNCFTGAGDWRNRIRSVKFL